METFVKGLSEQPACLYISCFYILEVWRLQLCLGSYSGVLGPEQAHCSGCSRRFLILGTKPRCRNSVMGQLYEEHRWMKQTEMGLCTAERPDSFPGSYENLGERKFIKILR